MVQEMVAEGFIEPTLDASAVVMGKYWVAFRDGKIVRLISMSVPSYVDFDKYHEHAVGCLGMLGEVKAGEVIFRDGKYIFAQRKNHNRRSKSAVVASPKEFDIDIQFFG